MINDNYLDLGNLISDRLHECMPDHFRQVTVPPPIIKDQPDTPTLAIFLEADLPISSTPTGDKHKVRQTWTVLIITRDEKQGVSIARVLNTLAGWVPQGYGKLERVKTEFKHDHIITGYSFFPLAFATEFVFTSKT